MLLDGSGKQLNQERSLDCHGTNSKPDSSLLSPLYCYSCIAGAALSTRVFCDSQKTNPFCSCTGWSNLSPWTLLGLPLTGCPAPHCMSLQGVCGHCQPGELAQGMPRGSGCHLLSGAQEEVTDSGKATLVAAKLGFKSNYFPSWSHLNRSW